MTSRDFDIVITGGRIIDPETEFEGVLNLGIRGHRIATLTEQPISARRVIDASDLMVAPGLIAMDCHHPTVRTDRLLAFAGITTALDLHARTQSVDLWYDLQAKAGRAINYASSVALLHTPTTQSDTGLSASGRRVTPATEALLSMESWRRVRLDSVLSFLGEGPEEGTLAEDSYREGLGAASPEEVFRAAALAGMYGVHALSLLDPSVFDLLACPHPSRHLSAIQLPGRPAQPAAASSRDSTRPTPVKPPQDLGLGHYSLLALMGGQRLVPTAIRAHRRDPEAITDPVQPTEPLTDRPEPPSFPPCGLGDLAPSGRIVAAMHAHGEASATDTAPASDAACSDIRSRRTAEHILREVFRIGSLFPAHLLGGWNPCMKRKGRIQIGADADLIMFELREVEDPGIPRSLRAHAAKLRYVLVNGVELISDGLLDVMALPGRPIGG